MKRYSIALLCLLAAPFSRAETPVTDREQTLAFSSAELHALAADVYADTLEQARQRHELDRDAALLRTSRTIAARLIAQAIKLKPEAAHWNWALHLTDSPDVDAYSMAGGKLLLGASFLRRAQLSDPELAILIGHEIGHVIAEHVREQATAVLLRNPRNPHRSLSDIVAELNTDLAVTLQLMPLSRMQEIEADQIGVRLAAMAGFPPAAALGFYAKLARLDAGSGSSVLDTHASPRMRTRIAPALAADSAPFYRRALLASGAPGYAFR